MFTKELATKYGKKSTRKGTPNKATESVRSAFKLLVENNLKQMQSDIDSLEPKDRLSVIVALAKFLIPTIKAVDVDLHANIEPTDIPVRIVFRNDDV